MTPLLLASTSPARRELLGRLGLPFEAVAPPYVEADEPGLSPSELALHHAAGKAHSVASLHPGRIAVGSDQTAEVDGDILGKPGTERAAVAQLLRMSGRTVAFHTGLAVVQGRRQETALETFRVRLRHLTLEQATSYVARERPLACAGSFKVEGLGIALMEELEGRDYTALIGLPLIALTGLLQRFGLDVLLG